MCVSLGSFGVEVTGMRFCRGWVFDVWLTMRCTLPLDISSPLASSCSCEENRNETSKTMSINLIHSPPFLSKIKEWLEPDTTHGYITIYA